MRVALVALPLLLFACRREPGNVTAPAPSTSTASSAAASRAERAPTRPLRLHRDDPELARRLETAPIVAVGKLAACPHDCRGGITELVAMTPTTIVRGAAFEAAGAFLYDEFACGELGHAKAVVFAAELSPKQTLRHPHFCQRGSVGGDTADVDATLVAMSAFEDEESARNFVAKYARLPR